MPRRTTIGALVLLAMCTVTASAAGQEDPSADASAERKKGLDPSAHEPSGNLDTVNKANNPLADLIAVQLHNYYIPKLYGVPDESANTFWLRVLSPYKRLIPRLSLPVKTSPSVTPGA